MKILITSLLLFSTIFFLQAQGERACGTMQMLEQSIQDNPSILNKMQQDEISIYERASTNEALKSGVITIPVVVHIVYNNATQNISDNQIFSQITVMNEDFRRTNADAINTLPEFLGVAADSEIDFCLATIDPNGDPTTGIQRVETTRNSWGFEQGMKYKNMYTEKHGYNEKYSFTNWLTENLK